MFLQHAMNHRVGFHQPELAIGMALFFGQKAAVEWLDRVFQNGAIRNAAVGMVADNLAIAGSARRHMRQNPVVVAVLAAVDHIGKDLLTFLNGVPKKLEDAARHFRMTDHAVRLSDAFSFGVTSHLEEDIIAVGHATLQIGLADNDLVFTKKTLNTGDG